MPVIVVRSVAVEIISVPDLGIVMVDGGTLTIIEVMAVAVDVIPLEILAPVTGDTCVQLDVTDWEAVVADWAAALGYLA